MQVENLFTPDCIRTVSGQYVNVFNACELAREEDKLTALMHDASEAYLLDMPKPIKDKLINYKVMEDGLMAVMSNKFGFQWPLPESVKLIDMTLLEFEWKYYMLQELRPSRVGYRSSVQEFLRLFKKYSK